MSKCKKYINLIYKEQDEIISDRDKIKLNKHLSKCENCKEEYKLIKNIISSLEDIETAPLPENFNLSLRNKLVEYNMSKGQSAPFYKRVPVNIAATLALALGITVFALNNNGAFDTKNHSADGNKIITASDTSENKNYKQEAKEKTQTSLNAEAQNSRVADFSYSIYDEDALQNETASQTLESTDNILADEVKKENEISVASLEAEEIYLTLITDGSIDISQLFSDLQKNEDGSYFVNIDRLEEIKSALKDTNIKIENESEETLLKDKFILK